MKINGSLNLLRGDKVPLEVAKSDVREKSMIIICIAGESGSPPAKCQDTVPTSSQ